MLKAEVKNFQLDITKSHAKWVGEVETKTEELLVFLLTAERNTQVHLMEIRRLLFWILTILVFSVIACVVNYLLS